MRTTALVRCGCVELVDPYHQCSLVDGPWLNQLDERVVSGEGALGDLHMHWYWVVFHHSAPHFVHSVRIAEDFLL